MPSVAYSDYTQRLKEPFYLIRGAIAASESLSAGAMAKGASILSAAALERYMNDVIVEQCEAVKVDSWTELSEGQKRYFARAVARPLYVAARAVRVDRGANVSKRDKLRGLTSKGSLAFERPATWDEFPRFGVFMKGAASPEKIDRFLMMFDPQGRSFSQFLAARNRDRRSLFIGLTELIRARHTAAHAKQGTHPGPVDIRDWMVLSWRLTREIEAYLGYRG
jgi:hypothetical protein